MYGPEARRCVYVLEAMRERAAKDVEWRESRGFDASRRAAERDALAWAVAQIDRIARRSA